MHACMLRLHAAAACSCSAIAAYAWILMTRHGHSPQLQTRAPTVRHSSRTVLRTREVLECAELAEAECAELAEAAPNAMRL
jgi:hypothetical protein